jgi:hydrogenase nickel incorporation protein HypA/HybF
MTGMHEFSLACALRDVVLEEARAHRAERVRAVTCRVGTLRQVVPSLLETAFAACTVGTIAEGAGLTLEVEPVTVTCSACGAASEAPEMVYVCPHCDAVGVQVSGGQDLLVSSIEIDQETDDGHPGFAAGTGGQRRDGE